MAPTVKREQAVLAGAIDRWLLAWQRRAAFQPEEASKARVFRMCTMRGPASGAERTVVSAAATASPSMGRVSGRRVSLGEQLVIALIALTSKPILPGSWRREPRRRVLRRRGRPPGSAPIRYLRQPPEYDSGRRGALQPSPLEGAEPEVGSTTEREIAPVLPC